MKIGLTTAMALLAIGLLLSAVKAAPVNNYDDTLGTGTEWTVVLDEVHYDDCWWSIEFAGKKGWSDDTFILIWPGGGVQIRVQDGFWFGDFYSLWMVDTATGTTKMRVFTTPEVETDYHHSCASNPYHTGLGSTWSDGTFCIYLAPGTYEFKVRDELLPILFNEGVDPDATLWSPAGFYVTFSAAPIQVIPEVPIGTIAASAAMMIAFAGFVMRPKFKRLRM